jgi:FkbM family methyltransferase
MIRSTVRRLRSYYDGVRLRALGTEPKWAQVAGGFEMFIDPKDDLDQEFYLGTFEPAMRWLIREFVQAGDTCLDIGAQKGYVSLTMARAVGHTGRVFSFEADARAAEQFRANVNRANQQSIHLLQCALGEQEGTCTFVLSNVLGWSSRFPNEVAKTAIQQTVEVQMHTLDSMVEREEVLIGPDKLSFIKLDVEGSEPYVIRGMRKLLSTARPLIFLEVNYESLGAAGSSAHELQTLLQDSGYDLFQPRYRHYFRTLSLFRADDLGALRPPNSNFTNVVAIHRTVSNTSNRISRLIQ